MVQPLTPTPWFGRRAGEADWPTDMAVVSHIAEQPWVHGSPDALRRLFAVGLGSVRSGLQPYFVLSDGEKARADAARALDSGAGLDNFAAGADLPTARAVAMGIAR